MAAIVNRKDAHHARSEAVLRKTTEPLVTTWACVTEAMYLLHQFAGHRGQDVLWEYFAAGAIEFHRPLDSEPLRITELMQIYADLPMDFSDGTLVAAAESSGMNTIFTFDRHFFAYRIHGSGGFNVVP